MGWSTYPHHGAKARLIDVNAGRLAAVLIHELLPEQKANAEREVAAFEEFKKLSRLRPTKSEGDIWAMVTQGIEGERQWPTR
jgi:hypothetical protein